MSIADDQMTTRPVCLPYYRSVVDVEYYHGYSAIDRVVLLAQSDYRVRDSNAYKTTALDGLAACSLVPADVLFTLIDLN